LDLLEVELDLRVAGDLVEALTQAVGLGAAAADHDAGARGVHVDVEPVAGALDLDTAHGRVRQLPPQVVADLPILDEEVLVLLVIRDPAGLPVGPDAEPEPVRIDLQTHELSSSPAGSDALSSAVPDSSVAFVALADFSAGSAFFVVFFVALLA